MIKLKLPNDTDKFSALKAGDLLMLSGEILTGRDAAHKRLFECLKEGKAPPVSLKGQTVYYVGPCFGADGAITAAGPTTSMRMDAYAPALYDFGVAATVGKGDRGEAVYEAVARNKGIYFAAIGGAGAIYGAAVKSYEACAYQDLGTEAIFKFQIEDFPVVVAIDSMGNSIY
jgi:fumarate hydratase subunit beta